MDKNFVDIYWNINDFKLIAIFVFILDSDKAKNNILVIYVYFFNL